MKIKHEFVACPKCRRKYSYLDVEANWGSEFDCLCKKTLRIIKGKFYAEIVEKRPKKKEEQHLGSGEGL
jgi:hypothetical protein